MSVNQFVFNDFTEAILNEIPVPFDEIAAAAKDAGIRVRQLKPSPDLFLLTKDDSPFNGIILEKDTNRIVCAPTSTFENGDNPLPESMSFNKADHTFEYCEDGTIIRLYNYNDTWYTATTKCIDAKYSYWATPKTFDQLFWQTVGESFVIDFLDPKLTYLFVLLHEDNRIVIPHKKSRVVFLGSYFKCSGKVSDILPIEKVDTNCIVMSTEKVLESSDSDFITVSELVKNHNNDTKRGIVVTNKQTNKRFKIDFPQFIFLSEIRGNTPFIGTRYLELLSEPKKLEELQKYWPEENAVFLGMWNGINLLIKNIHTVYYQTHIKHQYKIDDKHPYFRTIRQLHAQYKLSKTPITPVDIWNKIAVLPSHIISKLLM
jgi:hypothetical protein